MPPKKKKIKKPIVASTRKTRSQMRQKASTSNKNEEKTVKTLKGKPGKKKFGKFHCLNESESIDEDDKNQSDLEKSKNSEEEDVESKETDVEEDLDKEVVEEINLVVIDDKNNDIDESEVIHVIEDDSNDAEVEGDASPETIEIIIENVDSMDIEDGVDKVEDELSEQLVNLEVSKAENTELIVPDDAFDSEMVVECDVEEVAVEESEEVKKVEVFDEVVEKKDTIVELQEDVISKSDVEDIDVEKMKISAEIKEEEDEAKVQVEETVKGLEKIFKADFQCAMEMIEEKVEAIEDVKPVVVDKIVPSRKSKRISLKAKTKIVETREAKIVESKDVKVVEINEKDSDSIEIKESETIQVDESVKMTEELNTDKKEDEKDDVSKKSAKKVKDEEEGDSEKLKVKCKKIKEDEEDHVQGKKSSKKVKDEEIHTPMDTDESNSERSEGKKEVGRPKKKVKKVVKMANDEKFEVKKKKKSVTLKVVPKNKQLKKKMKIVEETNDDNSIRRSNRIKTISSQKKSSKGKGLVKKDVNPDHSDNSNSGNTDEKSSRDSPSFALPKGESEQKPVKVKSRWRRSSELEMNTSQTKSTSKDVSTPSEVIEEGDNKKPVDEEVERRLKQFDHLKENQYLTERISCKEAKKMTCDCFLTKEEIEQGEFGCGEDCLNRLLMIECGNLCTVGDRCTNKRFQKGQAASCEVFRTDKKGLGIRASANIPYGEFILEYVGEVLDPQEFEDRAADYSKDKNRHYYFMALRADAVIDATQKGNISRFINHSCDPNAETQKWTVNGELRIGFFSKRTILAGEEITFDYQFQRYGKEAQKCYCEAPTCRGWLGEEPDDEDDEEEEEDEDEEDEEEEEEEEEEVIKPPVVEPPKVVDGEIKEKSEEEVAKIVTEEIKVAEEDVEKEVVKEKPVEKKKKEKKQKVKILRPKRKPRKDIFEDLDLDDEIASLQTTGLKNQAHTLKLSRLIVRAKETAQRLKLLQLLKHGELPCRRLFLDYHGLRLMHGWMTDAQQLAKQDSKMEYLRLEILQTVATLPIPNKTMLQDSKVLSIVEKWAVSDKPQDSPMDSESNSPKELEMTHTVETKVEEPKPKSVEIKTKRKISEEVKVKDDTKVEEDSEFDIRRSVGMDVAYKQVHKELNPKNIIEELSSIFDDEEGSPRFDDKESSSTKETNRQAPKQPAYDIVVEILALATKLLEEWSSLKEVFRIPKKERIEQMKEHEREADKRYKALSLEQENVDKNRENRYRTMQRPREKGENERRKEGRKDDRHNYHFKISKHERRKLFAMKVEQDEEERRRKQQEMWRQHEKHCMMMGTDPRLTAPYDPNRGYQCIWNQQIGQWQNYPLPDHSIHPHIANPNFPYLPPRNHPNIINPMQNLPPTHKLPPPIHQIPPPHISNIYPPGNLSSLPHNIPLPNISSNIPQAMLPPNLTQPNMPPASMGTMPPMPNIPAMPSLPYQEEIEDPSQVKFMGPIPPPVKLPPKWKCVKDKYGRPYYYHVKFRKSQWHPPEFPPEEEDDLSETSSSSDTSSLSSDSSSDDSDSDIDDNRLMMEIKNKFKRMEAQKKLDLKKDKPFEISLFKNIGGRNLSEANDTLAHEESMLAETEEKHEEERVSSLDKRLIEEFGHSKIEQPPVKKRRLGLVQEIIISPRNEQDKLQFKEDVKRYRQTKEMLKRQKELIMQQSKKHLKIGMTSSGSSKAVVKLPKKKLPVKTKIKDMESNAHAAKKIKEIFRMNMAGVMVGFLNSYRKPDCKQGRIVSTDDFKHLARKLTHFVMLKELKHCQKIEDLTCTESVKGKAKEFVKKYMAKFGEQYVRPPEDIETYP